MCPVCARKQQGRCGWQREVGGGLPRGQARQPAQGLVALAKTWELLEDDKQQSKWSDLGFKGTIVAAMWSTSGNRC